MTVRSSFLASALALALLLPGFAAAGSYLRVVSWNTRHAGWSGETNWTGYAQQMWNDFGSSSSAANGCDIVFLQEVMYSDTASQITSALESVSGYDWAYAHTSAIGRSSYKERYAVIYRTDRVSLLSSTTWSDSGDYFEREPQIVKVRHKQTNADYTFINWHTIWGTTSQRQAELKRIDNVFRSVQDGSTADEDVILLGDHNYSATASYWSELKNTSPAVTYKVNTATTINSSCAYASAYDHFWFQSSYVTEYSSSGRDYISNVCTFRSGLSDHAPVWAKFYSSSDTD